MPIPELSPRSYVLISGKGRSGSNRLLDMLDTSRLTVCRNEVNAIPGSDFARVGGELFPEDFGSVHLSALRDAISRADVRRSARDRLSQVDKEYLSVVGRAGLGITGKHRLRRVLSVTGLIDDPGEWDLPDLFLNKDRMSHVRLVLKLNSCPAWAMALGKEDERCKILHNIRDPFEYLQSWYNRFIKKHAGTSSFESRFEDVPRLLAHFGRDDADRLRQPTEENLVEVELWRWRYINERLQSLAPLAGRYLLITYPEMEADIVGAAKKVFDFADLPFGHQEEMRVTTMRNVLFQTPHSASLDPELCENLVSKILEDSPLRPLLRAA